jgi:hypothetical protein
MSEHGARSRRWLFGALGAMSLGCTQPPPTLPEGPPAYQGPGFSIRFRDTDTYTVVPGEVLAIDLVIDREEGFEGPIDLSASDAPGVVVIFRPATVLHRPDSDLLIVADQTTQRRTHQIQFTATSEGHPTKTATLSLTVVDTK